ncbi:platelet glycoprotein 4-like [Ciona intestinalis]
MGCCNKKCGLIATVVVGGILVILGGIINVVFEDLFNQILLQESVIAVGTLMYDNWIEVATPTYISYYLYNMTNGDEFLAPRKPYVKPNLQEIGPYVFREYLSKDTVYFLDDDAPQQVYYRQKTVIVFDRERSAGDLSDLVTTVNPIGASMPAIVDFVFSQRNQTTPDAIYTALNTIYLSTSTKLIFTRSVNDILFGFQDNLFDLIANLVNETTGVEIPDFGLFSTYNDSRGWFDYQVYTGKDATDLTNIITAYKNQTELDYWGSKECNMLNGTDGTTTPPFMVQEDRVYFFIDDICRSLYATFVEEVVIERVPGWKYAAPSEVFQCPNKNPNNKCFCPDTTSPLCHHDGAILINKCQFGAPIMVSSPHFLYGDGFYLNMTTGIEPPNVLEHEAALVYEPFTGAAIKADKRLQINILIMPTPKINAFNKINEELVFPVVWINESATVGKSDADLLYGLLVLPAEVVYILQIILCILGSLLFLGPLFYFVVLHYSNVDEKANLKIATHE